MAQLLEIRNEEDAWKAFFKISDALEHDNKNFDIRINDWQDLHFILRGDEFRGTFTSESVRFVHEIQSAINRSYAIVKYGVPNANVLTNEERDSLRVFFRVEKGSSDFLVSLKEVVLNFIPALVADMDKDQKYKLSLITIIGALLLIGGTYSLSTYLEHLRQDRLATSTTKLTEEVLSHLKFADKEQTTRMDRLMDIAEQNVSLSKIVIEGSKVHDSMLKTAKKADSAIIYGTEINQPSAKELTKSTRDTPKHVRMDGVYRVKKINDPAQDSSEFQMNVQSINDKTNFAVVLDSRMVPKEDMDNIFHSLKQKTEIFLKVNARMSRGKILDAHIVAASTLDQVETTSGSPHLE